MTPAARRALAALGTLALAAALLLAGWLVPSWQAETADAQARQRSALRDAARRAAGATNAATDPAAAPLAAALPPAQASGDRLAALLADAAAAGLQVASMRQARPRPGAGGVLALPLTLQAGGSAAALRRHLAQALAADPALVLDSLRLQRADARSERLEIELRWTLLAAAPGHTAATAASAPAAALPARSAFPDDTASATSTGSAGPVAPAWRGSAPPPAPVSAPATAAAAAPAGPQAPPFPYRWIGVLDDGQAPQALLAGPLRSSGVRAGERLDAQWRLDRIAAGQLELTWLPGSERVAVRAGLAADASAPTDAGTPPAHPAAPAASDP